MGVSAPKKYNSRLEWMQANGWGYVVIARALQWELREYPDRKPVMRRIALAREPIVGLVDIRPGANGWTLTGVLDPVPRHEPFEHALDAFRWWVGQQSS